MNKAENDVQNLIRYKKAQYLMKNRFEEHFKGLRKKLIEKYNLKETHYNSCELKKDTICGMKKHKSIQL